MSSVARLSNSFTLTLLWVQCLLWVYSLLFYALLRAYVYLPLSFSDVINPGDVRGVAQAVATLR